MKEKTDSSMPWIKVETKLLKNRKLLRLSFEVKWRYLELSLLAGDLDAEGYFIDGNSVLSIEDIAWRIRAEESSLEESLKKLVEVGEVTFDEKFGWMIVNFSDIQGRPQSERRKKWREYQNKHRAKIQNESQVSEQEEISSNDEETDSENVINDSSLTSEDVINDSSLTSENVINESSLSQRTRGEERREEEEEEERRERGEAEVEKKAAAAVFQDYESNIELLTPMIRDKLNLLIDEYPPGWIQDAISEAVEHNARKFAYIDAILKNWKANGRGNGKPKGKESAKTGKNERKGSEYISGQYASFIDH